MLCSWEYYGFDLHKKEFGKAQTVASVGAKLASSNSFLWRCPRNVGGEARKGKTRFANQVIRNAIAHPQYLWPPGRMLGRVATYCFRRLGTALSLVLKWRARHFNFKWSASFPRYLFSFGKSETEKHFSWSRSAEPGKGITGNFVCQAGGHFFSGLSR